MASPLAVNYHNQCFIYLLHTTYRAYYLLPAGQPRSQGGAQGGPAPPAKILAPPALRLENVKLSKAYITHLVFYIPTKSSKGMLVRSGEKFGFCIPPPPRLRALSQQSRIKHGRMAGPPSTILGPPLQHSWPPPALQPWLRGCFNLCV